jgi:4a-hydroxytetrahydrobiopterin dehydratase
MRLTWLEREWNGMSVNTTGGSMRDDTTIAQGWTHSERPANLFRRFEFGTYAETRAFLDRLADLSKETGYYPDIGFGKTHANITIHARNDTAIGPEDLAFAQRASELERRA